MISETVTTLKPHWLDLMRTAEFTKKLRHQFPDLEFEVKQTEVNLCGLADVVKKARLFILEKVTAAAEFSYEISESISRVFAKDEARPYLREQLLLRGISATWICKNRSVIVYTLDDKHLKGSVRVLKNAVVEQRLHLSALNLREDLDQSLGWKDLIRRLCKEDSLLDVSVSGSVLIVACMKSSFEKNKNRIADFLSKNSRLSFLSSRQNVSCRLFQWQ